MTSTSLIGTVVQLAQVFAASLADAAAVSAALAEEFPGAAITVTEVAAQPPTTTVVEGAFVPPAPGGEAPAPGGETPAPSGEPPAEPAPVPEPVPVPAPVAVFEPVPEPAPFMPQPVPNPAPAPAPLPGAPTGATAAASATDPTKATVTWTAPAYTGTSAIASYNVTCTAAGPVTVGPQTFGAVLTTGGGGFAGLAAATAYTCRVAALNSNGAGAASAASASFTTLTTTPGAPTGVTAAASLTDPARATVTWAAPAYVGTSTIAGYSVSCTAAGPVVVGPLAYAFNATTTGADAFYALAGATTYTCAVAATNTAGAGAAAASAAFTTMVPPGTLPLTATYAISSLSANTTSNNAWSTQNLGDAGTATLVANAPARNGSLTTALWLTTACSNFDRASAATAFGEAVTTVTNPAPALLLPAYTAGAFNGMPLATFLAQLDQISYSFYKATPTSGCTPNDPAAPALKLELGSAEGGYTVLVWEPWAGVNFPGTDGNGPVLDAWYWASITAGRGNAAVGTTTPAAGCTAPNAGCATGGWWSTRNSPAPLERWASLSAWAAYWDDPASTNAPVQTGTATKIVGYSSKAVIQKISLEVGTYNNLVTGFVGELRINGTTFDWTYSFG